MWWFNSTAPLYISKAYWLLYKWLFSDLLYKESFDIVTKWHPNSATFLLTKTNDT